MKRGLSRQRRASLVAQPLGLRRHAAGAAPGVLRLVVKYVIHAGRPAAQAGLFPRQREGGLEFGLEPGVARQADHVVHPVGLAPGEDRLPANAAVGADDDARARAAPAHLGDDFFQGMDRAVARVAVRGAQLRPDDHVADEGVERQVAVGVVVAVEEAALLFAVQRIVGGVEVEHHLASVAPQALHAEAQQERPGPGGVEVHLVVAALAVTGQLQPVERGSGGERRAVELVGRGRQERIVTQGRVVVEVLVAERQAQHPLGEQRAHRVRDEVRIAPVHEARGEFARQPQRAIQIAQQQHACVGTEASAVKTRDHLSRTKGLKRKLALRSVRGKRIGCRFTVILLHTK